MDVGRGSPASRPASKRGQRRRRQEIQTGRPDYEKTARDGLDRLVANVERIMVGKREVIRLLVAAILCEGHVLIEDVPGTGKTLLAKALATSLELTFRRVQFTPDLLPSDLTGSSVFNQQTTQFDFREGPIFANVLVADEINRATPRTQSALLEAMEERQTSPEGLTLLLPRPFLVMATQNPIELEGTFPLPEAQLDRFLIQLSVGYPTELDEAGILERFAGDDPFLLLKAVIGSDELVAWQEHRGRIRIVEDVRTYLLRIVRATREHPDVQLGGSPRASLSLYRACQAWAMLEGRGFVIPDDVKLLAAPVLRHRIIVNAGARLRGISPAAILDSIVAHVPVPVEAEC